jgi:hypothetical protein
LGRGAANSEMPADVWLLAVTMAILAGTAAASSDHPSMPRSLKLAMEAASYFESFQSGSGVPNLGKKYTAEGLPPQEQALFHEALQTILTTKAAGGPLNMESLKQRAHLIEKGGVESTNEELMLGHSNGIRFHANIAKDEMRTQISSADDISAKHVCSTPAERLESLCVRQLRKASINKGKILWATTVLPCFLATGIQALGKDEEGRLVTIGLYNFILSHGRAADAHTLLPVNTRLGIKEPYYKLTNSGNFGIRIDNPCNLIIQPIPAKWHDDDDDSSSSSKSADKLKEEGNIFFAARNFNQAIKVYSEALA